MAVLLTTVIIVLLVGHYLMKIPFDDLMGVVSGANGQSGYPGLLDQDGADRTSRTSDMR